MSCELFIFLVFCRRSEFPQVYLRKFPLITRGNAVCQVEEIAGGKSRKLLLAGNNLALYIAKYLCFSGRGVTIAYELLGSQRFQAAELIVIFRKPYRKPLYVVEEMTVL